MGFFKPTDDKPISVVKIKFTDADGRISERDYPKNVRIPGIGEYIHFGVFYQGYVDSIYNYLDNGFFITVITVNYRD